MTNIDIIAREAQVFDKLAQGGMDHGTLGEVIVCYGAEIRESVQCCHDLDAVVNWIRSKQAGACD